MTALPPQGHRRTVEAHDEKTMLRDGDGDPPALVLSLRTFPATDSQIPVSRRFAQDTLAEQPTFPLDNAMLLLSEVTTNAVCHSGSESFTLGIAVTANGRLLVAVRDGGHGASTPHVRAADVGAIGGRGMALVDALATRWGVTREEGGGLRVWFELAAQPVSAAELAGATGVNRP